jgi:flagellar M-ring protein FliF
MLWPTGDGAGGGIGAGAKLEAEQQYAAQLSALANAMLARTLGDNKADVRVHAVLNLDQSTVDSVTYEDEGTPITTETERESLDTEGTVANGAAGTTSNIPGYAANGGAGGNSNYDRRNATTEFGVDKTVERRVVAPGAVERLDVAILFDESVTADQVVDLRNAVGALVGLDAERGDTVSTATLAFAEPPKEKAAAAGGAAALLANPMGLLKYVVIGVGSILFLFFMRRGLRRRESEQFAPEPTWLRQIEGSVPIAQLGPGPQRPTDPVKELRDRSRNEVEEIVKREPDKVASQVGQWLRE